MLRTWISDRSTPRSLSTACSLTSGSGASASWPRPVRTASLAPPSRMPRWTMTVADEGQSGAVSMSRPGWVARAPPRGCVLEGRSGTGAAPAQRLEHTARRPRHGHRDVRHAHRTACHAHRAHSPHGQQRGPSARVGRRGARGLGLGRGWGWGAQARRDEETRALGRHGGSAGARPRKDF